MPNLRTYIVVKRDWLGMSGNLTQAFDIEKLISWLGVFEWTMVESDMLNVDTKTGSWKLLVPTLHLIQAWFILLLFLEFTFCLSFKLVVSWSFSPSRQLALSMSPSPRSSRPKSRDQFPCFCLALASGKVRINSLQNASFYKRSHSNKNKKPPNKAQKSTTLTSQADKAKKIHSAWTCMNAIFKL